MLTPKQQAFVAEYLRDLNGAAAARRAGYSERTANRMASENLSKPDVAAAIAAAQAERAERTKIDADWVLTRLHRDATANIAELFNERGGLKPADQWPEAWRQGLVVGVESIDEYRTNDDGERELVGTVRKVRLSERAKYLEMIGKHVGVQAFRDKLELGGPNGGPVQFQKVERVIID